MIAEEKVEDRFEGKTTYRLLGGLDKFVAVRGACWLRSGRLSALGSEKDHPGRQILLNQRQGELKDLR